MNRLISNNKKIIDERVQNNYNDKKELEDELINISHFGCLSTKMINWYIKKDIEYYWGIYNRQVFYLLSFYKLMHNASIMPL